VFITAVKTKLENTHHGETGQF